MSGADGLPGKKGEDAYWAPKGEQGYQGRKYVYWFISTVVTI